MYICKQDETKYDGAGVGWGGGGSSRALDRLDTLIFLQCVKNIFTQISTNFLDRTKYLTEAKIWPIKRHAKILAGRVPAILFSIRLALVHLCWVWYDVLSKGIGS